MGNVVISPNLKHTRDRIDPAGNIINAKTKEIIQPVEQPYIPTPEEIALAQTPKEIPVENKGGSKIDEMISKKIEEIINRKIEEALNKL